MSAAPSKAARAGALMAAATMAMAATAGVQAVLYLSSFGTDARTDAFFAAFALYTVFGIFTQSIRLTSVPLLVGEDRRLRGRQFAAALAIVAVPVILACGPLAGPLAEVLAPGVGAGARSVTEDALRVLGGAMVLQLAAAGAATLLGIWDRFDVIFGGYVSGALAGLVSFVVLKGAAGELVLGWSMLAMGAVTCAWMLAGLLRARTGADGGGLGRPGRLLADAGSILGRTLVYFVVNGLYLVTLAFASREAAGDATVLSYAYLYASYLVAGTGVAVGISRVPDMTRGAQSDWEEVVADTVPHGFRYAVLVCAPALAGLVAAGAPLIGEVLPGSFGPADVESLRIFAALLIPWTLAALVVNLVLPALFALGRARLVNVLSIPVVALHAAATLVGASLFGIAGIVGALWVAPALFGAVLLAVGAGARLREAALELAADALRFGALAAAAFGIGFALGLAVPEGAARAVVVAVIGGVLYLAAVRLAAPGQLAVLLGARRAA